MCPDCGKTSTKAHLHGEVCQPCWQWRLDAIASAKRGERTIADVQKELSKRRISADL